MPDSLAQIEIRALAETIRLGFVGVNDRLDILNGRVYTHAVEIAALKAAQGTVSWAIVGTIFALLISAVSALVAYYK